MSQQGTNASHFGGHARGHQPTAQHHQAANAILTVTPPPVAWPRRTLPRPLQLAVVSAYAATLLNLGTKGKRPVLPDDPAELIAGKDYGSEGTAQRYLCALLIDGSMYGYNKSWPLSERGVRFVARMYSRSFGTAPAGAPPPA
jgi:hypothetical protein